MSFLSAQRFQADHFIKPGLFLITGMLISALGISAIGPGALLAAALCIVWAIVGLLYQIRGALAVLLFAAMHLPVQIEVGFACFFIGVAIALIDIVFSPDSSLPAKLRPLRNELRDAEFQQEILHRHIARYPVLLDSCTLFSSAQELGQLASTICEQTKKLVLQYNHIGVFFGRDKNIYCAHAINNKLETISLDVTENEQFVIAESRLLVLRDDTTNHVYIPLRGERRSDISVHHQGQNGVLYISFRSSGIDDEFIIDILRALGRLAGLTLAAVNLMEQARALALHDDLTGLYGRHEYQRRLEEQAALCKRNEQAVLGLVMCDMDHLKKFNDEFGHPAGDAALKAIANSIRSCLPEDGVACRFGGEEFSAFIVGSTEDDIKSLAEALHTSIRETNLAVDKQLTASIGWSILHADENIETVIQRADEACYTAKSNGRDQVISNLKASSQSGGSDNASS